MIIATVDVVFTNNIPTATITISAKQVSEYKVEGAVKKVVINFSIDDNFEMTVQNYLENNVKKSVEFNIPKFLRDIRITDETYVSYGAFMNCSLTSIRLNDIADYYDTTTSSYKTEDEVSKAKYSNTLKWVFFFYWKKLQDRLRILCYVLVCHIIFNVSIHAYTVDLFQYIRNDIGRPDVIA